MEARTANGQQARPSRTENTGDLEDPSLYPTGVLNIPFLTQYANATRMDAVFWIGTIKQPRWPGFMKLHYTQDGHFAGPGARSWREISDRVRDQSACFALIERDDAAR
jgi:hypothetical protein